MLHLFDANVLITASNTYYPLEQVPEFWSWIVHQGTIGNIKLPQEILEEVLDGRKKDDPLLDWVKSNRSILEFPERVDPARFRGTPGNLRTQTADAPHAKLTLLIVS